jgi:hypothetical protein
MSLKNPGARLFILVIVPMMALVALALSAAQPVLGQPEAVARLTPVQGLVQRRADADLAYEWETLTEDAFLFEGDWVQTDHVGLAEVVFFDGNLVEILPDSLLQVEEYTFVDDDSPVVVIDLAVGDLLTDIEEALDDESRYEVNTPSAVVSVRGTRFFTTVTWLAETIINHETGTIAVSGVSPDGTIGPPTLISTTQRLPVAPDGQIGEPGRFDPPAYPPPAPLAPETCGNAICEPGETAVCALDCLTPATCGNGICEAENLEGPVTCRVDCVPAKRNLPGQPPPVSVEPTTRPPVTGQPCTISTPTYSVIIRVGPGFERGRRFYLTPYINIPVQGQFTDIMGNLWWNIQPPNFIPAEINRYWVLAAEVIAGGDCIGVPDIAAPPVVAPQPPPGQELPPYNPFGFPHPVPTAVPTDGPAIVPTPVPTDPAFSVRFSANRDTVNPLRRECATLYWIAEGVSDVLYEGRTVKTRGTMQECPLRTTTYTLTVILPDGSTMVYTVTITADTRAN